MPRLVEIPSRLTGQMMPAIAAAAFGDQRPQDDIIDFDFTHLWFTEPCGVTLLANLVEWLTHNQVQVRFVNADPGTIGVKYLDDAKFFERYLGRKLNPWSSLRSTTIPLHRVTQEQSHAWIRADLLPWLSGHMGVNLASLYTLQASLSELFNNIKDHTTFDIGSIFVQFFPKKNVITLSIADFGDGIPATVRRVAPGLSAGDAILAAVQDGFTSRSRPTNHGVGLHYLLTTTVLENEGTVTIFSETASVTFAKGANGSLHGRAIAVPSGFYPGTTIEINLRTDRIKQVPDEEEDMTW